MKIYKVNTVTEYLNDLEGVPFDVCESLPKYFSSRAKASEYFCKLQERIYSKQRSMFGQDPVLLETRGDKTFKNATRYNNNKYEVAIRNCEREILEDKFYTRFTLVAECIEVE